MHRRRSSLPRVSRAAAARKTISGADARPPTPARDAAPSPEIVFQRFPARGRGPCSASMPARGRFSANIVIRRSPRPKKRTARCSLHHGNCVCTSTNARSKSLAHSLQAFSYTERIFTGHCGAESVAVPQFFRKTPGVVPSKWKTTVQNQCTALQFP